MAVKRKVASDDSPKNKDGIVRSPKQDSGSKKVDKTKRKNKRKTIDDAKVAPELLIELPPAVRKSDEEPLKRARWTNKQRVLIFSSRGIGYRDRHLMNDFKTVMPHSKSESKMNKKEKLVQINEAAEMKNANHVLYFESRKKKDLYLWAANTPDGPSAKFLVENIHTMDELKMTGNCLKGSRPIVSFDKTFDTVPHLSLLRELFIQIFGTPNGHPKSQPFIDRVMTFSIADNRIWIRNFQIVEEDGALAEIGPRLTLNLIKIFEGSFRGECLYENPLYVSPNLNRRQAKLAAAGKYINRVSEKLEREERKPETAYPLEDELDDVFRRADKQAQGGQKSTTASTSTHKNKKLKT
ncbi:hypothetical protein RvY_16526 [Ramazzottius varieornatus]|uniref:Ribosome biogenesis protein BRX1 homolog n=1 Tax=Ramazzottius varieornatus TaxID=947166 RepID=A0A1D1VYS1_RAMVA|nr:hypothetical protein RvY_16526 [Ramazzottius varieornatus]